MVALERKKWSSESLLYVCFDLKDIWEWQNFAKLSQIDVNKHCKFIQYHFKIKKISKVIRI